MAIPIMAIATLAAGAASGAMKMKTAKDQAREAGQLMRDNPRPTYNTPTAINRSTEIARMLAMQGLPGQSRMQDQLRQTTSSGVRAATDLAQDPATKAAIAAGLYSQELGAVNQMNIADANFRVAGQERLMGAYNILAQYQDKEFDYNKAQPYDNAMAAASALTGASMQNRMAGTEDILGGISSAALGFDSQAKNAAMGAAQQRQSEAAMKAANIGVVPAIETALGGLGTITSPTVSQPTVEDISIMDDYQIMELPEFAAFASAYPLLQPSEQVAQFKISKGL